MSKSVSEFMAWRTNSGYRLRLAKTERFTAVLAFLFLAEIKLFCFCSVLFQFYFNRAQSLIGQFANAND